MDPVRRPRDQAVAMLGGVGVLERWGVVSPMGVTTVPGRRACGLRRSRLRAAVSVAAVLVGLGACDEGGDVGEPASTHGTPAPVESPVPAIDCITFLWMQTGEWTLILDPDASPEQIDAVRLGLDAEPTVRAIRFMSPTDSEDELRGVLADSPELAAAIRAEGLAPAFRFTPGNGRSPSMGMMQRINDLPGVLGIPPGHPESCSPDDPAMLAAARQVITRRYGADDLLVSLRPGTTASRVRDLRPDLALAGVREARYLHQAAVQAEQTCLYEYDPAIPWRPAPPPTPSLRLDVGDDDGIVAAATTIEGVPDVESVRRRPLADELLSKSVLMGPIYEAHQRDCPVTGERIV